MSRLKKTKFIHCKIHKCADFSFTIDKLSYDKHVYTHMLTYLKSGLIGKDYFLIKKESVKEEKINYNDNIRFTDAPTTRKKILCCRYVIPYWYNEKNNTVRWLR